MKKIIEELYDYYLNNHPLPEIYVKEDGAPHGDNVYVRALFHDFDGTIVPTRRSELEDIVDTVCVILEGLSSITGRFPFPKDDNSIKLYNGLCHCLAHIDYEVARYSYDFEHNCDLNKFYSICKSYRLNYCRLLFCGGNKCLLRRCDQSYGFKYEYLNLLLSDENLTKKICLSYCDNVILSRWIEPKMNIYNIGDWVMDLGIKHIWNQLPFEYIRDNYRDYDYYKRLQDEDEVWLLAMCIDAVKFVHEDEGGKPFAYIDIERSLGVSKFISRKLSELYDKATLKEPNLTITERIEILLEQKSEIQDLLKVKLFEAYRMVIKTKLEEKYS